VIICPGGAYGLLDYKAHVAEFVADYKQQGIAVIALLYKVPTTADLALTEGKLAIRLVRSRATDWNLDPQKIGMQGYSAGGHLLVNLMSHADDGDPQAQDPLDRLSCRPNFVMLMCPWNIWTVDKYQLKAPLPPVFMACADDDNVSINSSDPLAARLSSSGGCVRSGTLGFHSARIGDSHAVRKIDVAEAHIGVRADIEWVWSRTSKGLDCAVIEGGRQAGRVIGQHPAFR